MKIVGVIGGSKTSKDIYELAFRMGKLIGKRRYVLLTGGLGGVMEAASKGAKEEGGLVIGILPGNARATANRWVDVPIATGMSHARNVIIAQSADILIAIDGAVGTQSEIAFGHIYKKKIIGIKCTTPLPFEKVETPEEAIEKVDEFFSNKQT
ncbi:TIGR00725 family protein [candidate division WOR-3 bacterium]|nr:TIGR00725 family protein [candidate division WOR-3 bacterium]